MCPEASSVIQSLVISPGDMRLPNICRFPKPEEKQNVNGRATSRYKIYEASKPNNFRLSQRLDQIEG